MRYVESLRKALLDIFAEDERCHLLGEDVLDPYGGAFKVTMGLSTAFPDRIHTTPISEGAIIGVAAGMAMRGLRPVAELMFGDFITLCTDQLVNHATKFRGMYNGKVGVPLVVRTPMGAGRGYGPTHSQSLEKLLFGVPDLTVVAPSHAHDPGAMLRNAIADPGVTLFLENKLLYPEQLDSFGPGITASELGDPRFPTIVLRNHDDAADVLLIGYGGASRLFASVLATLSDEEINATAALVGRISPFDVREILPLVRSTTAVLIVEEGTDGFNWGSEVAVQIYEQCLPGACPKVRRLATKATIIPTARSQEDEVIVTKASLLDAIWNVLE